MDFTIADKKKNYLECQRRNEKCGFWGKEVKVQCLNIHKIKKKNLHFPLAK